jgi:hypothetical protein
MEAAELTTYFSPFECYPLLHYSSPLRPPEEDEDRDGVNLETFSPCSSSASPNLNPLKVATAVKALDPSKRVCQYEVPGGGICRDPGCEDVHLSRVLDGVMEPSGTCSECSLIWRLMIMITSVCR